MTQFVIEMTNGLRAWGLAALLFAWPALRAFFHFAWRRAFGACEGVEGHWRCLLAFVHGFWIAGRETNLRVNFWLPMALLLFAGIAGAAIFVSSNFFGGYSEPALTGIMLPLWALVSASAWGVTIQTARERDKGGMALACGLMLVTVMALALSMEARA